MGDTCRQGVLPEVVQKRVKERLSSAPCGLTTSLTTARFHFSRMLVSTFVEVGGSQAQPCTACRTNAIK